MFRSFRAALLLMAISAGHLEAQHLRTPRDASASERLFPPAVAAQDGQGSEFWVGAGAGVGSSSAGELAGTINGSYRSGGHLLSARGATTGELFGDDLWDLGLLYGRAMGGRPAFASVAVGVAAMGGTRRSGLFDVNPVEISTRVSVPLEVQLFWRPLRFLGVGVYGFANVNDEESFTGATLGVQLGGFAAN